MRTKFLTLLAVFSILMIVGCPSPGNHNSGSSDTKITSLQAVVDKASAGSTINLSQYGDITDWNATVSKSVTIANGTIGSGELTITVLGVTLNNIKGSANVTTNSSMKITGSSLSSLTIGSNAAANASLAAGRGENEPYITVINSVIAGIAAKVTVSLMIQESHVTELKADGGKISRLTLRGEKAKVTTYTSINADSQIIVENGAAKPTVSGVAEANITEYTKSSDNVTVYDMTSAAPRTELQPTDGVYSKTIAKSSELWNEWMMIAVDSTLEPNKCGIVSFDIKTDRDVYLAPKVFSQFCNGGNGSIISVKAGDYQNVSLYTGIYAEGVERLYTELVADTLDADVTLQVKNVKFAQIDDSDPAIPQVMIRPYSMNGRLRQCVLSENNGEYKFIAGHENDDINAALPVEEGKFYKVSFKVTAQSAVSTFGCSLNVNGSEGQAGLCWAYSGWPPVLPLNAGAETLVEAYIGVAEGAWNRVYDSIDTDKDTDKSPYLKWWIRPGTPGVYTFKDFNVEEWSIDRLNDAEVKWQSTFGLNPITKEFNSFIGGDEPVVGKMMICGKDNDEDSWNPSNIGNKIILNTNCVVWDKESITDLIIEYRGNDIAFYSESYYMTLNVTYTENCTLHFTELERH